jgi:hypothetical protein
MALPTLDAVFASAADVPRRYMLAKWLVEELGETGGNSSVAVSGAGSGEANGTYTYRGDNGGKGYYNLVGQPDSTEESVVVWIGDRWLIIDAFVLELYESLEDTEFPWLVETWTVANTGENPVPTVTEIPPQSPTIADYITLPERYLWAKIAVAAGAPLDEASYISLPKQYVWKERNGNCLNSMCGRLSTMLFRGRALALSTGVRNRLWGILQQLIAVTREIPLT